MRIKDESKEGVRLMSVTHHIVNVVRMKKFFQFFFIFSLLLHHYKYERIYEQMLR
jgi:hypothetical protein